jgi:hypothetical protein
MIMLSQDVDLITTKLEIGDEITTKLIPDTILKNVCNFLEISIFFLFSILG